MANRKFKHPTTDHWLKRGNNHLTANRDRNIERNTMFLEDEKRMLFDVFLKEFIAGILSLKMTSEIRKNCVFDDREKWSGTMGEKLFEILN